MGEEMLVINPRGVRGAERAERRMGDVEVVRVDPREQVRLEIGRAVTAGEVDQEELDFLLGRIVRIGRSAARSSPNSLSRPQRLRW